MKRKVLILIIIQLALFGCNTPLKQDKIDKWFYEVPVYNNSSEIIKMLLSDKRFTIEEIPDTSKNTYVYRGRIQQPNLPTGNITPDSSVIDFTSVRIKKKQSGFAKAKLLTINYFLSNSAEVETLYEQFYDELKPSFTKAHDIVELFNNDTIARGKEIIFIRTTSQSQKLSILKKAHVGGSKSLELTILMGEQ